MAAIEIRKVESRYDLKTFIEFHYDLYKGNAYDVPNLYTDEVNTLRKDKNAAFEFCEAEYFMAFRDGRMVGRVAAIINHRANEKWYPELGRVVGYAVTCVYGLPDPDYKRHANIADVVEAINDSPKPVILAVKQNITTRLVVKGSSPRSMQKCRRSGRR